MIPNYYYHELTKKYVTYFGTLFNDIHIQRTDESLNTIQEFLVPISYGPKDKTIARLDQDPNLDRPFAVLLPRMSFEIIDMEYSFSIAIKDKKVRLRFSIGQFWSENKKTIYDYTAFFNNTGEIKEDYTDAKQSLENSMNEIASSLYYNIR